MTEDIFKWWFVVGPVAGFVFGGIFMFLLIQTLKQKFLDLPPIEAGSEEIGVYLVKDREIKEMNRVTKQVLDSIRLNG
jgi:hypothetical protein